MNYILSNKNSLACIFDTNGLISYQSISIEYAVEWLKDKSFCSNITDSAIAAYFLKLIGKEIIVTSRPEKMQIGDEALVINMPISFDNSTENANIKKNISPFGLLVKLQ